MGVQQQYAHDAAPELLRESGVSFGLQNTLDGDPFTEATTPENRHASLLSLAPHTDEIQRFIPLYRHTIHPFVPLLVDIDEFELRVCEYLESRAAGDLRHDSKTLNQWFTGKGINTIAVILATLSCSSYFSDISITERSTTALKFVARAFQALRLANYMLRPSVEAVQTLLLLGNTLQNTGQSDGSWILLGTTIRLAQALGLHAANTKTRGANSRKKEALWSVIVWQDCFLSVCHGRPSGISKAQLKRLNFAAVTGPSLSYFEVMCRVGCLCVDLTEDVPTLKRSVDLVEAIDRCYSNALPHLQSLDECRNLHQRLEFFALQINMSFTIAVVCRPAMKKLPLGSGEDHYHQFLTTRAKQSLFTTLRTFLAFQALSSMPLRNWSMLHSTLTSMLLLSVWEETRHDPQSRDLQERLVGLLLAVSEEGSSADTDSDGHPSYYTQWLSPRSIRTLIALQSAIRNTPPLTDHVSPTRSVETLLTTSEGASLRQTGLPVLDSQVPDQIIALLGSSVAYDYDQFDWSTVDLSPFAFIEETVNNQRILSKIAKRQRERADQGS
ncbi:fungal specific transcription factor [Trichoderma harzianum]|uniref:Fungal specific transcription factor n=1 Tax=Trichoderma harzianum TaxID=5544 RepID=A0A0G0A4R0_TRIHA|nr:fungal specific transcription factor [Trichoderma harzianum]